MSHILPVYNRADITFFRGKGVYLYTSDNTQYLDFAAGIAVDALGHSHPHLVREMKDQIAKLWHVSNLYHIDGMEKLAERICKNSFADYVFFCNSGAEAVECGIKAIRKYFDEKKQADRYRIITFEGSFHGRTLATISAAKKDKLTAGFGPLLDGFDQVPYGDLAAAENAINDNTAGILVEPILGEGGIKVAEDRFLQGLRRLADKYGLLLFFDEIQCGMGRSGKLFAHEWSGIKPDILASAKGIGSGFPLGACLFTKEAATAMTPGSHGSTYGGNPLAMRAGNAVMDIMLKEGFFEEVQKLGNYLTKKLKKLKKQYPSIIEEIRGKGLMIGVKLAKHDKIADSRDFVAKLRERKLLTVAAADNVVRILPPLIIKRKHINEAIFIMESLCREIANG